jgi:NADH-quinone oxidoreductase subunit H
LFFKEDWIPPFADRKVFVIAPAIVMITALLGFVVIPFAPGFIVSDINIGVLFFLATSSMGAYSIILGGWASNNKYALLGAMRGAAQMISYEVFMGLSMMGVVLLTGSFNLQRIVEAQADMWFVIPQFIGFVTFLIAGIAETHRLPFDIPESESEIIAGFHSEYSGMKFGMFFVGEYVGIILISSITVCLYFGGWMGSGFSSACCLVHIENICLHHPFHFAESFATTSALRSANGFWMENSTAHYNHQPDGNGSDCVV